MRDERQFVITVDLTDLEGNIITPLFLKEEGELDDIHYAVDRMFYRLNWRNINDPKIPTDIGMNIIIRRIN